MTEMEPTLAAMNAAAESARTANHAAYHAPRTTTSVYDRTGALQDLLMKVEQLTRTLEEHAHALVASPPAGLFSDDGLNPLAHADAGSLALRAAAESVRQAERSANRAFSHLSHLGQDVE